MPAIFRGASVVVATFITLLTATNSPAAAQVSATAHDVGTSTQELSATALGNAAYDGGDYETAEQYYRQALGELGDVHDSTYAEALHRLGTCYYMAGKFSTSESLYKDLIKLDEQLHGSDSLEVASDLFSLTGALRRQYLWEQASPVILRTLEIRRKALGENHKLVAMSWMDLAVNYQRSGKFPQAENAFLKTIAIREKLPAESGMIAPAYHLYAKLLKQMERMPEAESYQRRAVILNPLFGEEGL